MSEEPALIFRETATLDTKIRADAQLSDAPVTSAWFDAPICRNCGAALDTPYCSQCGQKAAKRFLGRDLGKETWERLRLFELRSVKTLRQLLLSPGTVARDYVMGRRNAHMHPLTLLIALVAVLVVMLAANQYFGHYNFSGKNNDVDLMSQRVIAYANWSFSLGIFAIFAGSWSIFRRRLGYNAIEHAILSVYCQNIILAVIIVNLLPTLIWRSPEFVIAHKSASQYYIPAIKLLIVGAAYKQFFLLDWRSNWLRLLLACSIYAFVSLALLRAYAAAILWLVSRSM
jgi:hypothetical protein